MFGLRLLGAMRPRNKLGLGDAGDVVAEDLIRVVEIGEDDVEAGEVFAQRRIEFPAPRKKPRRSPGFDGTDFVDHARVFGQGGDVRIAQHFEMGLGKLFSQRGQRGQGEDEIADGPAANDQDFAPAHKV